MNLPKQPYREVFLLLSRSGGATRHPLQRVDSRRSPILERMRLHPAKQDGPVVAEVPPAVPGASFFDTIEDAWYVALVDIGFEGKGGKYLVLPPDYTGDVPAGYSAVPPKTYNTMTL